ncbi:kinase-like protein [Pleurotus eryngii]|uniref:Kinase-like protein n=1 Tax=Pleurotus eryngii TaxID=5323 RepID=A0A9P5ZZ18_PLEER|nr:kinase-like protein [Pleurotus eryngii]
MPPVVDVTPHVQTLSSTALEVLDGEWQTQYHGIYTDPKDGSTKKVLLSLPNADGWDADPTVFVSILNRIHREMHIWVLAHHPNVVQFFGLYKFPEKTRWKTPALVSAFCEGGTLREYLGRTPDANRYSLVVDIAKGLDYLHQEGILHGNLCPESVMIQDDGIAALTDFGRAKMVGLQGYTTQSRVTTRYVSPEAWRKKGTACLTAEADVYSFGMTALYTLSGNEPFYTVETEDELRHETSGGTHLTHENYSAVQARHWSLIEPCWQYDAKSRPSIHETLATLSVDASQNSDS